ncbi:MAG: hypothetical protein AVDCRST_MAG37-2824, partial [uncultured Rubrobacteraceae bacterium]
GYGSRERLHRTDRSPRTGLERGRRPGVRRTLQRRRRLRHHPRRATSRPRSDRGRPPGHLRLDLQGQQHRIRADGCPGAFGRRDPGPRYGGPQGPIRSSRRRAQRGANLGLGSRGRRMGDRRFPQHARGAAAAI